MEEHNDISIMKYLDFVLKGAYFASDKICVFKMASLPRVLIYGGKGALGSTCISYFKAKNWVSCTRLFVTVLQSDHIRSRLKTTTYYLHGCT